VRAIRRPTAPPAWAGGHTVTHAAPWAGSGATPARGPRETWNTSMEASPSPTRVRVPSRWPTHNAPRPTAMSGASRPTVSTRRMAMVEGSIRTTCPRWSRATHTLPPPVATAVPVPARATEPVARVLLGSIRTTVSRRPSTTHTAPSPVVMAVAIPPGTVTAPVSAVAVGSTCWTTPVRKFAIHTERSSVATQGSRLSWSETDTVAARFEPGSIRQARSPAPAAHTAPNPRATLYGAPLTEMTFVRSGALGSILTTPCEVATQVAPYPAVMASALLSPWRLRTQPVARPERGSRRTTWKRVEAADPGEREADDP